MKPQPEEKDRFKALCCWMGKEPQQRDSYRATCYYIIGIGIIPAVAEWSKDNSNL